MGSGPFLEGSVNTYIRVFYNSTNYKHVKLEKVNFCLTGQIKPVSLACFKILSKITVEPSNRSHILSINGKAICCVQKVFTTI